MCEFQEIELANTISGEEINRYHVKTRPPNALPQIPCSRVLLGDLLWSWSGFVGYRCNYAIAADESCRSRDRFEMAYFVKTSVFGEEYGRRERELAERYHDWKMSCDCLPNPHNMGEEWYRQALRIIKENCG
jgi:hypothetical protein